MERDVAWKKYDEADLEALEHLAAEYIDFISDNKTERECAASAVALAEEHGYLPLDQAVREGRTLKAGDKVWAQAHGKALILAHLGQKPLEQGLNILGAHIDSPRLDLKQNPLYESNGFTLFDTHYYGGIKNYQWVTLPLALHGVIAKKDGTVVDVQVGDDPDDPVFCVTDLLVHLAGKQMAKKANEVVEGDLRRREPRRHPVARQSWLARTVRWTVRLVRNSLGGRRRGSRGICSGRRSDRGCPGSCW